jgi:hypothetical protein
MGGPFPETSIVVEPRLWMEPPRRECYKVMCPETICITRRNFTRGCAAAGFI